MSEPNEETIEQAVEPECSNPRCKNGKIISDRTRRHRRKNAIYIPCPDCQKPELAKNCAGCEHFKHSNVNEHCYRYFNEPDKCPQKIKPKPESELIEKLREACEPLIDFANEDLPKGFLPPEKWLNRLKQCTELIKQALKEK